jgi:GNAT superfamily N-acetyltransferase
MLRDHGWPRELAEVRKVLPEHVQQAAPPGSAAYGSWIVVAEAAQRAVGLAWAVPFAGDPRAAYVEEVAVIGEYVQRGLGGELLRQVAEWMIELDRPELHIYPTSGSGWVERVGFRPEGFDSFFGDALIVATSR